MYEEECKDECLSVHNITPKTGKPIRNVKPIAQNCWCFYGSFGEKVAMQRTTLKGAKKIVC